MSHNTQPGIPGIPGIRSLTIMAAKLLWAPVVLDAEKAGKDGKPTGKKEKGVGVTKWKEREAKLQDFLKKLPDKVGIPFEPILSASTSDKSNFLEDRIY
eukprot:1391752-Amorphochlora_amoeboformis.AAC.2